MPIWRPIVPARTRTFTLASKPLARSLRNPQLLRTSLLLKRHLLCRSRQMEFSSRRCGTSRLTNPSHRSSTHDVFAPMSSLWISRVIFILSSAHVFICAVSIDIPLPIWLAMPNLAGTCIGQYWVIRRHDLLSFSFVILSCLTRSLNLVYSFSPSRSSLQTFVSPHVVNYFGD